MTLFINFALGLLTTMFQVYWSTAFGTESWTPQFWLVFVLWLSTKESRVSSLFVVTLTGLWMDGFAGGPMGTHATIGLISLLLSMQLTSRLQIRTIGLIVLGGLGGIVTILVGVLVVKASGGADIGPRFSLMFAPRVATMALLTPILIPLLDMVGRLVQPRPKLDRI